MEPLEAVDVLKELLYQRLSEIERRLLEHQAVHATLHQELELRLEQSAASHIQAHGAAHLSMEQKIDTAFKTHSHEHHLLSEAREAKELAQKEALHVSALEADRWRQNANEWRGAMDDRERNLMSRSLADQQFHAINEKIQEFYVRLEGMLTPIRKDIETLKLNESKGKGSLAMAASIFGGSLVVLGLIVATIKLFMH